MSQNSKQSKGARRRNSEILNAVASSICRLIIQDLYLFIHTNWPKKLCCGIAEEKLIAVSFYFNSILKHRLDWRPLLDLCWCYLPWDTGNWPGTCLHWYLGLTLGVRLGDCAFGYNGPQPWSSFLFEISLSSFFSFVCLFFFSHLSCVIICSACAKGP